MFTAGQAGVAPFCSTRSRSRRARPSASTWTWCGAAFAAAFGMWTPLPQILERCLHEVYVDRGWDLRTNANGRLADGDDTADAYPTLGDLVAKVGRGDSALSATRTRSRATCGRPSPPASSRCARAARGRCSTSPVRCPSATCWPEPTVVELEAMGDEGDKAFLTGADPHPPGRAPALRRGRPTAWSTCWWSRRPIGCWATCPTRTSEEMANPRGQAVETFSNLLSEIRAYGQGVIIADQVPVRLAPDVIKNTTLKIAHRTVSADDRLALGGAMAMDEPQTKALTTLGVGEAAVFGAGDDSPLLVRVPLAKDPLSPTPPADEGSRRTHGAMAGAQRGGDAVPGQGVLRRDLCGGARCLRGRRRIAADEYVQRTLSRNVLSTIDESGALDRLWDDSRRRRSGSATSDRSRARPAARAGRPRRRLARRTAAAPRGVWSFADTAEFRDDLRATLLDRSVARQRRGDGAQRLPSDRAPATPPRVRALSRVPPRLHAGPAAVPVPLRRASQFFQSRETCLTSRTSISGLFVTGRVRRALSGVSASGPACEPERTRRTP